MLFLSTATLLLFRAINYVPTAGAFVISKNAQQQPHACSRISSPSSLTTLRESVSSTSGSHYSIQISYEGRTCTTEISPGESILSAMERSGAADQLALPSLPSDCRRGNCLTCVGRHTPGSDESNLQRGEDGLSPYMSDQARKRGYILTCSSTVRGNGVKLEVGRHDDAWEELYKTRTEDEETQRAGRAAMAKTIRMHAENHVDEWIDETTETLRKTEY